MDVVYRELSPGATFVIASNSSAARETCHAVGKDTIVEVETEASLGWDGTEDKERCGWRDPCGGEGEGKAGDDVGLNDCWES